MRTTLTIDDQVAAALKEAAHRQRKPFSQVVNDALRLGLHELEHPRPKPYRLKPASLGPAAAGVNLDKARQLAELLEEDAIAAKLELRK